MAVDPTYPLYPIASVVAAVLLLLVFLTSFIRQSWNLGVAFLCFWLFFENLAYAANTVIWSDNADIKLYAFCDIVSHLEMICFIVKPMSTLIIMRRLYAIVTLPSVSLGSKAERRRDMAIEWTLGLIVPLLVAGPFYYVVQMNRFEVIEGFGCANALAETILSVLLIQSWSILPPLLSVVIYYPKVLRSFYRQRRDVDRFLSSDNSVSRTNYLRILAIASIDLLITLPMNVIVLTLSILQSLEQEPIPFYPGWNTIHHPWSPAPFRYADLAQEGKFGLAQIYSSYWTSPVLAYVIFGLFGLTADARASYWRVVCIAGDWFIWWKPAQTARSAPELRKMEFGVPMSEDDTLLGDTDFEPRSMPLALSDTVGERFGWKPTRRQTGCTTLCAIEFEERLQYQWFDAELGSWPGFANLSAAPVLNDNTEQDTESQGTRASAI